MKLLLKIIVITLLPFAIGLTINSNDAKDTGSNKKEAFTLYPDHIAGAYTGGFGEQSCHSCHFDYDLNQPEGELSVSGIAESFKPGREYTITVDVKREDMNRAGFQMTARFEDGSQAGDFEISENLATTPNIDNTVTYVQHGVEKVEAKNGEKTWQIEWKSPDEAGQSIIFNIAANAANGDASEFGDWIYLKEIKLNLKDE